ncbi:MAG: putative membrane protein [Methanobacteriaceae archaeon 41_258]|nr:MAG: putative membrane protein [Methanobacteriaceae archaeon 41_258]
MKLSNETKVSLVTVVCILALAVISKNVLHAQLDFISQYGPVWMLVVYLCTREECKKSKICDNPLFWSIAIILITLAILVVYAI